MAAGVAAAAAPPAVGTTATAPQASRPTRVLLAEDNVVNQRVAARVLRSIGCDVTIVGTGVEAIARLEREPFDICLMDVQMPEMGGFEATAADPRSARRGSAATCRSWR